MPPEAEVKHVRGSYFDGAYGITSVKLEKDGEVTLFLDENQYRHEHTIACAFGDLCDRRSTRTATSGGSVPPSRTATSRPKHKHKSIRDVSGGPWREMDDLR